MSNIIDLSSLVDDSITLKFGEDDSFTIPSEPQVQMVLQILDFEEKANKAESYLDQFNLFVDMVVLILGQDDKREVDAGMVKRFSFSQLRRIVEIYQERIVGNQNNPN